MLNMIVAVAVTAIVSTVAVYVTNAYIIPVVERKARKKYYTVKRRANKNERPNYIFY